MTLNPNDEITPEYDQTLYKQNGAYVPESGKIGKSEVEKAVKILTEYKNGKQNLETRIIENEEWYKLRQWELLRKKAQKKNPTDPEPATAWLFNSIANKHADAMDNMPEPNVLPREESDKESAELLSEVLPVILEQADYEKVYSEIWWYKLVKGCGVWGVFWDSSKLGGLGDVDIKKIDLLNLFWEPGITDIQQSRNVFCVALRDTDLLEQEYPQLRGKVKGGNGGLDISKYQYDDEVDTSGKSVVVDWYYKSGGKLHYCKFCEGVVLYATENDPARAERGLYDHGKYPFVFDRLYPEEGTPTGFSYVDAFQSSQLYIDKLSSLILKNVFETARRRFALRDGSGVNEDEFRDFTNDFLHVSGSLSDDNFKELTTTALPGAVTNVLQMKIEELKETSGNRDFSQGATSNGVTAASAIAALQEAGGKLSRDMLKDTYFAFRSVCYLVLELIRQFYDYDRSFRIVGVNGSQQFRQVSNSMIKPQPTGISQDGNKLYRLPVFDIKIRVQRSAPFNKMAQNELALQFFGLGFFNPQLADQAQACLELMEFEGKDAVINKIVQNGTMYQQIQQLQTLCMQLAARLDGMAGSQVRTDMSAPAEDLSGQPQLSSQDFTQMPNDTLGETSAQSGRYTDKAREQSLESTRV